MIRNGLRNIYNRLRAPHPKKRQILKSASLDFLFLWLVRSRRSNQAAISRVPLVNSRKLLMALPVLYFFFLTITHKKRVLKSAEEKLEMNNLTSRANIIQHNANSPIEDRYNAVELKNLPGYFLAVLDGHGGDQVAEYASRNLHKYFDTIFKELLIKSGRKPTANVDDLIKKALVETFLKIENEYYNIALDLYKHQGKGREATVGSCVTAAVVTGDKIFVANAGDSKAKLFRKLNKNQYEVIKLTTTFNAEKKYEQERLMKEFKAEKDIVMCKRPNNKVCYVKGRLQPTRSLGDFHLKFKEFNNAGNDNDNKNFKKAVDNFKGPYIKAEPEVKVVNINAKDEFIVLATDGFWDYMKSGEVSEMLAKASALGASLPDLNDALFSSVIKKAASTNNMEVSDLIKLQAGGKKRRIHDDVTLILFDLRKKS
jgi:pyruvate dehydrogenase phosphatase